MQIDTILEAFKKLDEDIDSMRKFYPNIKEDEFISFIELDPTYKKGSKKAGNYARWILKLANEGKIIDKNEVTDALLLFDSQKKKLKTIDIMRYKNVDDLHKALSDNIYHKELSARQLNRENKKNRDNADLSTDADLMFEDNKWEVWVPKTYAASCKLGKGTKWCTATLNSDDNFNKYLNKFGGKYYIIINKNHPDEEKYEFHFESQQFADINNIFINALSFLKYNPSLYDFFDKEGYMGKIYYTAGKKQYFPTYDEYFG